MQKTKHLEDRMNQRCISEQDLTFTELLGVPVRSNQSIHWIINQKSCDRILEAVESRIRQLKTGRLSANAI